MPGRQPRVIVGMSGGVDSSAAAALLREKGHDVVGVALRMHSPTDDPQVARADVEALEDACRVAECIGIPLQVVDVTKAFERIVVSPFCAAYSCGRTPSPCVSCNEGVKFAALRRTARELDSALVATGHYARKGCDAATGLHTLSKGLVPNDQSYFLFRLGQDQLRDAVFPLEGLHKEQVRAIAREYGLPVHNRPDSQDLCFVAPGRYRQFLRERCPAAFRSGPIVDTAGNVLGEHEGIGGYTVGQRRRLGIAHRRPLYVVAVRPEDNAVVVGEREETQRGEITVEDVNWLSIPAPDGPIRATVRIRYNHAGAAAEVAPWPDGTVRVRFEAPQSAPAPGQAAVFYAGDLLLGGGTIAGNGHTAVPPTSGGTS